MAVNGQSIRTEDEDVRNERRCPPRGEERNGSDEDNELHIRIFKGIEHRLQIFPLYSNREQKSFLTACRNLQHTSTNISLGVIPLGNSE